MLSKKHKSILVWSNAFCPCKCIRILEYTFIMKKRDGVTDWPVPIDRLSWLPYIKSHPYTWNQSMKLNIRVVKTDFFFLLKKIDPRYRHCEFLVVQHIQQLNVYPANSPSSIIMLLTISFWARIVHLKQSIFLHENIHSHQQIWK